MKLNKYNAFNRINEHEILCEGGRFFSSSLFAFKLYWVYEIGSSKYNLNVFKTLLNLKTKKEFSLSQATLRRLDDFLLFYFNVSCV